MTYGTRTDHYPATSKLLHWLVAACVLITAPVAVAMPRLSSGEKKMFKDCADCPQMVVIPAGDFTMGSPDDEPKRVNEHEDQARVSIIKPFAVGVFAVTRGEFAAFASATNHKPDGGC